MKVRVEYTKTGAMVADEWLELWGAAVVKQYNTIKEHESSWDLVLPVALESMVNMIRVLVVRGDLKAEDVLFFNHSGHSDSVYNEPILINSFGNLDEWPAGFCDKPVLLLEELLDFGINSRESSGE